MPFDLHLNYLAQRLTPARLQHSLGVMQVMAELAPLYDLDPEQAQLAGLAHDAGKELPLERMFDIARLIGFPLDEPGNSLPLYLHGPCCAYIAEHEMGIHQPLVLEAIYRHSYVDGAPVQSAVFCWCLRFADMIEPGRDWHAARRALQPLVYSGQMHAAARYLIDWQLPFQAQVGLPTHPALFVLQQKLSAADHIPNDDLPL